MTRGDCFVAVLLAMTRDWRVLNRFNRRSISANLGACVLTGTFLFGFLLPLPAAWGQDIYFHAEVSRSKVALGEAILLTLTTEGSQDVPMIDLPRIEDIDAQFRGPSTRISIVNGRYSSSKSFTYSIFPRKIGSFTIPSVSVAIAGKNYTSDPIPIEVVASGVQGQGPAAGPGQQSISKIEEKIFLVLKVPKKEVYVNEKLPVKIILFITGLEVSEIRFPEFDQTGLEVEKFGQPSQYQQVINGIRYHIVEFDTTIYPTRAGEVLLGPATVDCNIAVSSPSGRSSWGRSQGLFDDDFFDSFFDRAEKRPYRVTSAQERLSVRALPQGGRPADFSGAVGQFSFDIAVSPVEVRVGDPITVKMNLSGDGNLKGVDLPAFTKLDHFKVYDPQVKEGGGVKRLEQVIIPESSDVRQIPAVSFSYFDARLNKYSMIEKGPFTITVGEPKEGEGLKVVGIGRSVDIVAPEVLGQDIVFIKDSPGRFYARGRQVYQSWRFVFVVVAGLAAWTALYVLYRRTHKMETDVVYARRLLAPRRARKGLAEAKRLLDGGEHKKFYDALFKVLQEYLGNKLHLPGGAVTFDSVREKLPVPTDSVHLSEIQKAFEECDAIRYSSQEARAPAAQGSYERLERIIDYWERRLK